MRRVWLPLLVLTLLGAVPSAQNPDLAGQQRAASAAMNAGRYDEAARIYREMLTALPDEPGLLMNLGMALAMSGQEKEAIPPLERAVTRDATLLPAHLFLGSSYLALGDFASAVAPLERVVAAQAKDVESRRMLAQAYVALGRAADAVPHLRRITELQSKTPAAWYALGHGYNALTQDAIATFADEPADSPWRQLLLADALHADGRLTDAFALYRSTLQRLPSMVTIHESIARIYQQTGHPDWAAQERRKATVPAGTCARRKPLCEFRSGRHRTALVAALKAHDQESRYWRVRAANELALAAFKQLEQLPDSRERREVRATLARSQRRYLDAIAELKAALTFAPGDPGLLDDLGTAFYQARDYEQAVATLTPIVAANPDDPRLLTVYGDSLLQLQRVEEALKFLRRAVELRASDDMARTSLGRAYLQKGDFDSAIPLLEAGLAADQDGSLHVQLARAYAGVGQQERSAALLQRGQELQRAAQERADAIARRTITAPD